MGSIDISPSNTHILAFPFPAKGHINPLLHLCNCLAAKGFRITLITTHSAFKSTQIKANSNSSIKIECIEVDLENYERGEVGDYFSMLRTQCSKGLRELVEKYKKTEYYLPRVVIYDSIMPWVLDVAHSMGIKGASFFTQSFAVCSVYYHIGEGNIKVPFEKEATIRLPSMPALEFDDLPYLHIFSDANGVITRLLADQFSNIDKVDYVFFNTFEKLEGELGTWMAKKWPIITVGPTFSLALVNKKQKKTANNNPQGNYLFETNAEACLKWLDQRETNSVVYVSFGSIAAPDKDQMEEVAEALLRINCKFLWVVRNGEESKLPASFKEETSEQGLIINWCPQLEVLAHQAIACFVTHCGWNSTIEALSSGVPMVAVPQFVDQTTNAKFIADVWKVGMRVKVNDKGIVTRDEFERCIREVTESERGEEMRRNATKWREFVIEAVSEGGSSMRNMEEFASML